MAIAKKTTTNSVTLEGNLGAQATLYRETGKVTFGKARLAIWQGKDRPALWITVNAFNDTAEKLAELAKGTRIRITGRLKAHEYDGKQYLEVVAHTVKPVTRKPKSDQQPTEAAA